jgi:hypothetical protein
MGLSLMEISRKKGFETMKPRGDMSRRKSGDLSDLGGAEALEIECGDLAIDRLQASDECGQPLHVRAALSVALEIVGSRDVLKGLEPVEGLCPEAPSFEDMRGADIVRDAIDPGSFRTGPVEQGKAPPEGEVDLLNEVASEVAVGLVGAGETLQSGTVFGPASVVAFILSGAARVHHSLQLSKR